MKAFSFVFLLILTFAPSRLAGTVCTMNPYLLERSLYRDKPLRMQDTVAPNSNSCGLEWATFGTCCKPDDLRDHISRNENATLIAAKKVADSYARFDGYLDKLFGILKKVALGYPKSPNDDWNEVTNPIRKILNNGSNLYNFDRFSDVGRPENSRLYISESEKCWNHLRQMRISSLCSACSGRSSVFFSNGKGVLEESRCTESLQNCLVTLKMTFHYFKMLGWLSYLNRVLDGSLIRLGIDKVYNLRFVEKAEAEMSSNGLADLVHDLTPDNLKSMSLELPVCKSFLNLAKLPFINKFLDNIYPTSSIVLETDPNKMIRVEQNLALIESEYMAFEDRLHDIRVTWKAANGRTLQLDPTSPATGFPDIFTSDVSFLTPHDSMFDTQNNDADYANFMNLTLTFP